MKSSNETAHEGRVIFRIYAEYSGKRGFPLKFPATNEELKIMLEIINPHLLGEGCLTIRVNLNNIVLRYPRGSNVPSGEFSLLDVLKAVREDVISTDPTDFDIEISPSEKIKRIELLSLVNKKDFREIPEKLAIDLIRYKKIPGEIFFPKEVELILPRGDKLIMSLEARPEPINIQLNWEENYEIFCKKIEEISPNDIQGLRYRPHKDWIPRKDIDIADEKLAKCISNKENILIIGPPLSGKTRTVYQVLKENFRDYYIFIPRRGINGKSSSLLTPRVPKGSIGILFIDDMDKYIQSKKICQLIERALFLDDIIIVATCSREGYYEIISPKNPISGYLAGFSRIELSLVKPDVAKKLSEKTPYLKVPKGFENKEIPIGFLFLDLTDIRRRYRRLRRELVLILKSIKRLYLANLFSNGKYSKEDILPIYCKELQLMGNKKVKRSEIEEKFPSLLHQLAEEMKPLVELEDNAVRVDDAVPEYIIEEPSNAQKISNLEFLIDLFAEERNVEKLRHIGNKAIIMSIESSNASIREKLIALAIKAYNTGLELLFITE